MNHGDEAGPRRGITRRSSARREGVAPAALWAVAAGRNGDRAAYGLAHQVAVVGWSRTGDLTAARARHDVAGAIRAAYPDLPARAISFLAADLWSFAHDLAVGDVLATALPGGEIAFGRVTGPYRFDTDAPENRRHQRAVEWLRRRDRGACDDELLGAVDAARAVRRIRALAPPTPSQDRRVSRRSFVRLGAAAGAAAAVAAVWRPWRSSSDPTAAPTVDLLKRKPPPTGSSPFGRTARWVQLENAKRGTTAWNVSNGGTPGQVEGYCSQVSAVRGDTVALYVSTIAPTFHVEAYRVGWYGGTGGRLIWSSPEQPGQNQGPGTFTAGINMTEANWTPSVHVPITTAFPPGCYLFKLVGSNGIQQLVPLTVRDDASKATYLVQNSVTSWQAYNDWHGYNLYQGQNGAFATRSRIVSFDRPYARGLGQSDFLGLEFPLVMLIEQLGLDVTYTTDIDTHLRPDLLLNHKAYFSLGHDEYWSVQMRDGVEAARDHGVNLAFLGANACYRQIRLEASPLGPNRHQVCYKSATEDPIHTTNPSLTTVNWRSPPVNRPESEMMGEQYECNPVQTDMVVVDPSAWVFAGPVKVQAGEHLAQAVGSEYDRYDPNQAGPKNVQILCHSPVTCQKRPSYADMTYYSAPSGAGVIDAGSIEWITKLTPTPPLNNPVAVQVMKNIFAVFGEGPAGLRHPSVSNYAAIAAEYGSTPGTLPGAD